MAKKVIVRYPESGKQPSPKKSRESAIKRVATKPTQFKRGHKAAFGGGREGYPDKQPRIAPEGLSQARRDLLWKNSYDCGTVHSLGRLCGFHPSTICLWFKKNPEFGEAIHANLSAYRGSIGVATEDFLRDYVQKAQSGVTSKKVFRRFNGKGQLLEQTEEEVPMQFDRELIKAGLAIADPDYVAPKQKQEITQTTRTLGELMDTDD